MMVPVEYLRRAHPTAQHGEEIVWLNNHASFETMAYGFLRHYR